MLVGVIAAVGVFLGGAYSVLHPPLLASQALVVIPQSTANISTEVVIVGSEPVLSVAADKIQPPMSLQTLENQVSVKSLTSGVISISAEGSSAGQAESAANAVASSYIAYVGHARSPGGRISAQVLQPATASSGSGAAKQDILGLLIGLVGGLAAGIIVALFVALRDRRLGERDAIANSLGIPVLAAIQAGRPADVAGWTRLLSDYVPEPVDAWRMSQALRELGFEDVDVNDTARGGGFSATVLSMSSDPGALALGPQLAVFAASLGILTALVIGQHEETNVTAALRTACDAPSGSASHSQYLRTFASDGGSVAIPQGARLTVVVLVADGKTPARVPETLPTAVTVLGVTAGAATANQLARLATAAATRGRDVVGFFVANPDPSDRTSGRFPRAGAGLAGRVRGSAAESAYR
jgi:capsular polysaccharide biosynthesis protein